MYSSLFTYNIKHSTFNIQHFIDPTDNLAQDPRQRQRDDDTDEECEPVVPRLRKIIEHKVEMDEIALQAQRAYKSQRLVEPLGRAPQDAVADQDKRDGQRDIEHALDKQRELSVANLLKEEARGWGHDKHDDQHPDALTINGTLLPDHLAHIDTNEEDGHPAPEDLQMANGAMHRTNPLNNHTPYQHQHR